jgi:hypothetical protein
VAKSSVDVERLRCGTSLGLHMIGPCALHVCEMASNVVRRTHVVCTNKTFTPTWRTCLKGSCLFVTKKFICGHGHILCVEANITDKPY